MDERFVDLRSTKNPKARIKMLSGHFATKNSHVNTYIDMSTVKTRHNNARETARTLAEEYLTNTMVDTIVCLKKHRSDRGIYGGDSRRQLQYVHERGKQYLCRYPRSSTSRDRSFSGRTARG